MGMLNRHFTTRLLMIKYTRQLRSSIILYVINESKNGGLAYLLSKVP